MKEYNNKCWSLYTLQHSLLNEYNNKCWSLYIFTTFIVERIQRSMLIFIYFYNIHCWTNTTINVDLYIFYNIHCWTNTTINVDLYIFLQHWLLKQYNNKRWSLSAFYKLDIFKHIPWKSWCEKYKMNTYYIDCNRCQITV